MSAPTDPQYIGTYIDFSGGGDSSGFSLVSIQNKTIVGIDHIQSNVPDDRIASIVHHVQAMQEKYPEAIVQFHMPDQMITEELVAAFADLKKVEIMSVDAVSNRATLHVKSEAVAPRSHYRIPVSIDGVATTIPASFGKSL